MKHRFFHAFKWQAVVDVIKNKTKGIVLIAASYDGDKKIGSVQESEQVIDWRGFPKGEDFRTL